MKMQKYELQGPGKSTMPCIVLTLTPCSSPEDRRMNEATTIYQNMYNDLLRSYSSMLNFMKCRYLPIYSLALHQTRILLAKLYDLCISFRRSVAQNLHLVFLHILSRLVRSSSEYTKRYNFYRFTLSFFFFGKSFFIQIEFRKNFYFETARSLNDRTKHQNKSALYICLRQF